jgi:hypothetical protein
MNTQTDRFIFCSLMFKKPVLNGSIKINHK